MISLLIIGVGALLVLCALAFVEYLLHCAEEGEENNDPHEWHDDEYPHPEPRAK